MSAMKLKEPILRFFSLAFFMTLGCVPQEDAVSYPMKYCIAAYVEGDVEFARVESIVNDRLVPKFESIGLRNADLRYGRWSWDVGSGNEPHPDAILYIENRMPGMGLVVTWNVRDTPEGEGAEEVWSQVRAIVEGESFGVDWLLCSDVSDEFAQVIFR